MSDIRIEQVPVEAIIALRHKVLRDGLPIETARWSGDDDSATLHFAAFAADQDGNQIGEAICCASFMRVVFESEDAWQLRGMATLPEYQGQGVGKRLLEFAERTLGELPEPRLLWCNARQVAIGFYERHGWHCVSGTFDIPSAGPHRKMIKRI